MINDGSIQNSPTALCIVQRKKKIVAYAAANKSKTSLSCRHVASYVFFSILKKCVRLRVKKPRKEVSNEGDLPFCIPTHLFLFPPWRHDQSCILFSSVLLLQQVFFGLIACAHGSNKIDANWSRVDKMLQA